MEIVIQEPAPQPSNEQLEFWDQKHVWHSFTQMASYTPFIVESAKGCRIRDIHGNEYIDAVSSLWCNVHGHQHAKINAAIQDQLKKVAHVTNLGASNVETILLAKMLVDVTPDNLEHVFFCSDGANAIEVALKIAFQYWQQCDQPEPKRTKYIALSNAYHGDTIGTVSVGDVPLFHQIFKPLLFEPLRLNAPNAFDFVDDESRQRALEKSLTEFEGLLSENAGQVAAIVAEPLVQGAAGIKIHPEGFLRGIAGIAKKHNVLMIADEVAVGFGRTGKMFACEHEDVAPDILCLGKGLSGGYLPISATLTSTKVYNAFLGGIAEKKTLFHGHTFAGNPLACAASIASLRVFDEEKTISNLEPKIRRIEFRLERLKEFDFVESPRQRGMIAAFDLKTPAGKNESEFGYYFCDLVQQYGVRIRPLGNTVIIMPPLAISEEELDMIFDAIEMSLG